RETSLIVRKAAADFPSSRRALMILLIYRPGHLACVNPILQDMRGTKHEHAPRQDGHFLPRLGVPADPLALLPGGEGAEGRDLHRLSPDESVGHLVEHHLDKSRGFIAG